MQVRKNKSEFNESVDPHWAGDSVLESHVLSILSLMFPGGEAFFIRSVKAFADRFQHDEKMRADIRAFIGQEMQHSMAHERFNQAVKQNLPDMKWFDWLFTVPTFRYLEPFARKFEALNLWALSITAAAENMTAGFAENFFADGVQDKIKRQDVRELYEWHAAEEMEHRDLAFDMMRGVSDSYTVRMAGMAFAYAIIFAYVAVGTGYLLINDKSYNWENFPRELYELYAKETSLGNVFVKGALDYMRPGFHPSDNPMNQKALEYLNRMVS